MRPKRWFWEAVARNWWIYGQVLLAAVGIALLTPFLQAWVDAFPWWETGSGRMAAWLLGWYYPFPVWIAFVLAGLTIGLQSGLQFDVAQYRDAFVFTAVILILLWKPDGLLPTKLTGDRV